VTHFLSVIAGLQSQQSSLGLSVVCSVVSQVCLPHPCDVGYHIFIHTRTVYNRLTLQTFHNFPSFEISDCSKCINNQMFDLFCDR